MSLLLQCRGHPAAAIDPAAVYMHALHRFDQRPVRLLALGDHLLEIPVIPARADAQHLAEHTYRIHPSIELDQAKLHWWSLEKIAVPS